MKNSQTINAMTIKEFCRKYPLLEELIAYKEVLWLNPGNDRKISQSAVGPGIQAIKDAADRLERFRPYIASVFPETKPDKGLIESPLQPIPAMQRALLTEAGLQTSDRLLLKCDNLLPISGSIKARGGIYEVLKRAEQIAISNNLLSANDDYSILAEQKARAIFAEHSISVGSTGNLGLSIGIIGAELGFRVFVHMSADGRQWKKDLLREHGVEVIEYESDYSHAVAAGRKQAQQDPRCHFIDDENSLDLFLGYAVAAGRLQKQLMNLSIPVDSGHPLFVYLPCGVGGGPGGISYGLKQIFGNNVHCFFAEPTHSPCMLIGLYTRLHDKISVKDFGLDNITSADGLAVGRPSGFISKLMEALLDGIFTVDDMELYRLLTLLADTEGIRMEPSALAGMAGMTRIIASSTCENHAETDATHIVWGTGGSMVPQKEMAEYYHRGCKSKKDTMVI